MTPPLGSSFFADGTGRRGVIERVEFMIDGFRVGYDTGGGYRCACVEFAKRDSCKHSREMAGRLAAQGHIAEHLRRGDSKAYSILPPIPRGSRRFMR
jgi:hypothetical protein